MEVGNPNHKHPMPTTTSARFLSQSLMRERSPRDLRYYLERIGPESVREEVCEKPDKGERNQRVRDTLRSSEREEAAAVER